VIPGGGRSARSPERRALRALLAPVLLTFAAGGLLGFLAGERLYRPSEASGLEPDLADYHRALSGALDLDEEARRDLRVLLFKHQQDRRRLWQEWEGSLQEELEALDRRTEGWIRDHVLRDPARREAWERLRQPGDALAPLLPQPRPASLPGEGSGG